MFVSFLLLFMIQSTPSEILLLSGSVKATNPQTLMVPHTDTWQIKLKWLAPEGVTVKKGDPVARFDASTLINEIKRLEINLLQILEKEKQETAGQRLKEEQAEFDLLQTETENKKAKIDLSVPPKWVSPLQRAQENLTWEKTKRALIEKQKNLENTKQSCIDALAKLMLEKNLAKLNLKQKKKNLQKLTLIAQFDGPVIHRVNPWDGSKIKEGDVVRPSMVIAEIPSEEGLHIEAWANEVDAHRLRIGQKVALFFDAMKEKTCNGHISSIASSTEKQWQWGKGAYLKVIIQLDGEMDPSFIAGMSVQAHVTLKPQLKGLKTPLADIINHGSYVTRVSDSEKIHYRLIGYDTFSAFLEKEDRSEGPNE